MILRAKNITARQFAEEIGIQPSGMSHIMGGRNNPSLDFAVKVLKRYPEIDANWLLLGKGAMYVERGVGSEKREVRSEKWEVGSEEREVGSGENVERQGEMDFGTEDNVEEVRSEKCEVRSENDEVRSEKWEVGSGEDVERILFIYCDNTYEVLTPRR